MEDLKLTISKWPESERPREKLLRHGASSLSDGELVALFLGSGTRQQSSVELARSLLARFGGLGGLMRTDANQLMRLHGLGPAKVARLAAIIELAQRSLLDLQLGESLTSPSACRTYLQTLLAHETREAFCVLMLDNQHRVLCSKILSRGTLDSATIYPREVIRTCLEHSAAAVIFAHNHPSGSLSPSAADREITKRLKNALNCVEIRLLDHFIVSSQGCASMAELGMV